MTKWISPLESSCEILLARKVSLNSKTVRIFYEFLGDKSSVTLGTRFLRKSRKSENGLSSSSFKIIELKRNKNFRGRNGPE